MDETGEPGLPHAVALAWGVAELPQRGPKRELSIERIVDAAIEIADAEGLAAVSMARVAASLGFTTMSLYRYVTSKDDLLQLMGEAASGVPIPPERDDQDWREGLREWAATTLEVFREHPWFGDIPIQGAPSTPNALAIVDWGLRIMKDLPLSPGEKISTILLLSGLVRSFGHIERDLRRAMVKGAEYDEGSRRASAEALRALVTESRFPYLYPIVQAGAYTDDETADAEAPVHDDFAFGLERILDGVQARVEQLGSAAPPPTASRPEPPYPRDKAVKEAVRVRREAEARLREARAREKEAVAKARERAAREAERAAREAERAEREAERAAKRAAAG